MTNLRDLYEDLKHIRVEAQGQLVIVTLDSGHKGNAFCLQTIDELTRVARALAEQPEISTVILTGQPTLFSVGMNLADEQLINPTSADMQSLRRAAAAGAKMCRAWEEIDAFTIAAIEGPCVGGGVALCLALDLRVCAQGTLLYVPEIERGMNMSWQSVPRSVNLIGPAKTKRMFVLAEKLDANTAERWGWADYLTQSGQALEQAVVLAEQVAARPAIPARMCKQAINTAANALNHAVSFMDADQLIVTQHTEDYREGIESFLQNREAEYKGR